MSPDQYSVVLHLILLRTLPPDLGLLYRQRRKDALKDVSKVSASPSARSNEHKEIFDFLGDQVEIRENIRSTCPQQSMRHGRGRCNTSHHIDSLNSITLGFHHLSSGLPGCNLCNARYHSIATAQQQSRPRRESVCMRAGAVSDVAWATIPQDSVGQRTVSSAASVHDGTSRRCATFNTLRKNSSLPAGRQSTIAAKG